MIKNQIQTIQTQNIYKMTSNKDLGQSRDQLMEEMLQLANQSNFYSMLEDILKEILECRTLSPYLYLHKKTSLRSKFDNSKTSQYLCQLALYLSSANPLLLTKEAIINKLMSICIDKYNHLKMKEFETNQFINFLLIDLSEKDKSEFVKLIDAEKLDNQSIPVLLFAQIMYCTLIYFWAVKEINDLSTKLKNIGYGTTGSSTTIQSLVNCYILSEYLESVDEEDSILKRLNLEFTEGENVIDKIVSKVFELFDGNENKGQKIQNLPILISRIVKKHSQKQLKDVK